VVAAEFDLDRALAGVQQALQLQHALARDDDLAPRLGVELDPGLAQRQAMAVGGDAAQRLFAQVQQGAVEVVAHVLVRHREGRAVDQFLERRLGQGHALEQVDVVNLGELGRRQRGQGEAAASGADGHPLAGLLEIDLDAVGQGTADVEQLACRDRDLARVEAVGDHARHHFDLEIRAGEGHALRAHRHQQVRQHRQGLPAFHHTHDLAQRLEQDFALDAETHEGQPLSGGSSYGRC